MRGCSIVVVNYTVRPQTAGKAQKKGPLAGRNNYSQAYTTILCVPEVLWGAH